MNLIKKIYHRVLLVPGVSSMFRPTQRDCATVFMLHRFTDKELGITDLDPDHLRKGLDYLHRNKYEFISLGDLYSRLSGNGPSLHGEIVFTIDDGYLDQARIACSIFAEFDCPVTTFVTSGFLDGDLWFWWDKIEYIFSSTKRKAASVRMGEETVNLDWSAGDRIGVVKKEFVERCKFLEDDEKHRAIARLAENAEVHLPESPPAKYAPMSWDNVRECEKMGMSFGPHTVTHPVLSRTTAEQSAYEINESWKRLCAEAQNPVPVFCYPNGQWPDFGSREIEIMKKTGLLGAVVGVPGFADVATFQKDESEPFMVRRLSFPNTLSDLIQYVSGIERCKHKMRGIA